MLSGGLLAFAVLLGIWLALAGQLDAQDLVAGSVTAAVAVGVGFYVSQQGRALPSFRWSDVKMLVALPRQLVVETWQVFAAAAAKVAGKNGPIGTWSTAEVLAGTQLGGWRAARRDAVLTAIMSASPNTIVVDVDADAGTALIHRLISEDSGPGGSDPASTLLAGSGYDVTGDP